MDSSEYDEQIARKLSDAIVDVLSDVESSVVTRWVLLAESINVEGERGLWLVTDENAKAWDTLGMLTYAVHLEQARTTTRDANGE